MTKYVVKRVLLAILTVFIVCAITFFAMNAIPGGPFDGEKAISDEVRRVLEQRFNLDKPVWEQFFLYLNNLLHGDFGVSAKTGREIKTTIFSSFSVSAKLGGMAVLVALISGVVMGSIAALTRNKLPDRLIIFFSTLFTSLPSFVLGTLLLSHRGCPPSICARPAGRGKYLSETSILFCRAVVNRPCHEQILRGRAVGPD